MPVDTATAAIGALAVGSLAVAALISYSRKSGLWPALPTRTPDFAKPSQAAAYALARALRDAKRANGGKPVAPFAPEVVDAAVEALPALVHNMAPRAREVLKRAQKDHADAEARRKTAFDAENEEHVAQLKNLWEALGFEGEFAQSSEQWAKAGFQGMDPTTDLRGGGMLALDQFLALARSEPALVKEMLLFNKAQQADGEMSWFLTAVVSIQFTTRIVLGDSITLATPHLELILEDGAGAARGVQRVHAQLMAHFFKVWQQKRPSVMEYTQFVDPNVIETFFTEGWEPAAETM